MLDKWGWSGIGSPLTILCVTWRKEGVHSLEFSKGESAICVSGLDFDLPNCKENGVSRIFLVL